MADLNPSFAEGLAQGAQLLNQAIQFNIQMKQQQVEFAERIKRHNEMAAVQQQKLSLEKEVLELDRQKLQFQKEQEKNKLLMGGGANVSQLKFEVETKLDNYLTGQPMPIKEAENKSLGQIRHMLDEAQKQQTQFESSDVGYAVAGGKVAPNSPLAARYAELTANVGRLRQAQEIRETQKAAWVDALPPEQRSALGFTTIQEEANAIVQQAQQPVAQAPAAQRATAPESAPVADQNSFDGAIEAARTSDMKDGQKRSSFIKAAADQLTTIQRQNNRQAGTQKINLLFRKLTEAFPTDPGLTREILGELQTRRQPAKR